MSSAAVRSSGTTTNKSQSLPGLASPRPIAADGKRLVTFHYDQDYTDDDVDALVSACRSWLDAHGGKEIELVPAREGDELTI